MTPTRWLIVLFWVVVLGMLLKECHDTTETKIEEGHQNPVRQYFFTTTPQPVANRPAGPSAPNPNADVHQIGFRTEESTPGTGSFTCYVTVRNDGLKTARHVAIRVRPYRGVMYGSDGVGHVGYHRVLDTDILAQYDAWVNFPDLKPGQSAIGSAVFTDHPNVQAGFNPQPEIDFETVP